MRAPVIRGAALVILSDATDLLVLRPAARLVGINIIWDADLTD
jgi:hypothetical protein